MGSFLVEKVTFQTRMCFNKIIKYIDITVILLIEDASLIEDTPSLQP